MVSNEAILQLYMCPLCEKAKTALFTSFCESQYVVLGIHYTGQNDVSHVKVTICTGWSPKVLAC